MNRINMMISISLLMLSTSGISAEDPDVHALEKTQSGRGFCGTRQGCVCDAESVERRQIANSKIARAYALLAQSDSRYMRHAIAMQGAAPASQNLDFLYSFTNNSQYAGLAAASIIRICGITTTSIQIADHAFELSGEIPEDRSRICKAILNVAKSDGATLEEQQAAINALKRYSDGCKEANSFLEQLSLAVQDRTKLAEKSAVTTLAAGDVPDSIIKATFLTATAHTCDYVARQSCYQEAIELCKGDTRRISRIVTEIATEHTNHVPWAISVLANHGSSEDVPFLLSYTNDLNFAARAVSAVILIDGITSNSVELANDIMYRNLKREHDRYDICSALAYAAKRDDVSSSDKRLSISSLKRYSRTIPVTSLWADEFLLSLDPDYETSEDRKALLREVAERRVNDYQVDYATNALKRIDAKVTADAAKESR